MIRKATADDVSSLMLLTRHCVESMRQAGIEQWDEVYPNADVIQSDITAGTLDVLCENGEIIAAITVDQHLDPMWRSLRWTPDTEPAAAVHRLMVHPQSQGRGLSKRLMSHAEQVARALGCHCIRLDSFLRNPAAMALYPRLGYRSTGTVTLRKGEFMGFEKLLHQVRLATEADVPELEALIQRSVHELQTPWYSQEQMNAAEGAVFGVDRQLIHDATYFVVVHAGAIIGCGGWSRRKAVFGGDRGRSGESELIDPQTDPARIRAFFVHPAWARRGIGSTLLQICEKAIRDAGFDRITMVATLAGEPLYARFGYAADERYEVPMRDGLTLPVVRMSKHLT
jgi:GNAT superfamily N-acetyltransferase